METPQQGEAARHRFSIGPLLGAGAFGEVEDDAPFSIDRAVDDFGTDLASRVGKVEAEIIFLPQV